MPSLQLTHALGIARDGFAAGGVKENRVMHGETKFSMLSDREFGSLADGRFPDEFGRHSLRIWFVLSIVMSLAITAIFAKYEMVGLSTMPFLVVPVALTLCFKSQIARLGEWFYAGALVVVLAAAILFGL
jgi:hypothetical protein